MKMTPSYTFDGNVFKDHRTTPPTLAGYIFNFTGHGVFSPDGKVEASQEQIDTHNATLARMEIDAMVQHGRATLYVTDHAKIGTWASNSPKFSVLRHSTSDHAVWGGYIRRNDYWFTGPDNARWHGVNIGDNQIVRCRRLKG